MVLDQNGKPQQNNGNHTTQPFEYQIICKLDDFLPSEYRTTGSNGYCTFEMSQLLTGEFPDKSVMLGSAEASRSRAAISGSVAKCRGVEPVPFWTETSEKC